MTESDLKAVDNSDEGTTHVWKGRSSSTPSRLADACPRALLSKCLGCQGDLSVSDSTDKAGWCLRFKILGSRPFMLTLSIIHASPAGGCLWLLDCPVSGEHPVIPCWLLFACPILFNL